VLRRDLITFFDGLSLYLRAGYDLSYSWPEVLRQTEGGRWKIHRWLGGEGLPPRFGVRLEHLSAHYPVERHRVWFAVLKELYEQGAPLTDAVHAMAASLRAEQSRDWESFTRTLPTKANLVLLVCFLPPTLVLLFLPLLMTFDSL
jgi:hypothetical protein